MKKLIVVGNGMVGYKFCEKLVTHPSYKDFKLTVFGEEPRRAYDRVHLSEFYDGKTAEELSMSPSNWYTENNIDLHISEMIIEIDREHKTVISDKGIKYAYDILVLATGSSAFVPPIEGIDKEGVFVYRTIEDLEATELYAKKLKEKGITEAAVLGGGLLGLEAANAVKNLGLNAHIIEFAPRLMPRQLDQGASDILQAKIESLGLKAHLSKSTKYIKGDETIEALCYDDNTTLDVGMLVVSAGIRPRDEIARACGLKVGTRGGIVVNQKMETSDPNIYAIGECALLNQMIYGLVAPGYDMAKVVVAQITGNDAQMPTTIDMSTVLKLIGTDVASFGDALNDNKEDIDEIIYNNKKSGIYKKINVSRDGKRLLGGMLVGDSSDYNSLYQIYINGMKVPENPEDLILGNRGNQADLLGDVMDLPDTAQICSCESVTKVAICETIQNGEAKDLEEVISCTKAGTGCGGCKPMVKDLTNATLKSLGIEVKDHICPHFDYNRQELYDIIQVKGYRYFNEVLDNHGNGGHGCELCKPVVASLMATIHADTANVEYAIQDSNDRFLANIQRNGTYSVVPRVPGGEITPEKLIALGQIAKKYDLYTKITGGVRIDLFGATLNQLPKIWKELISHGFESGHAYGKSLRTVKTCVGSTWCRYGMDESVSFGIELENRYRGIRAPHKIKGGVSGCIRECAEARGKDFGIIAVEGGWNLYVGGNGGATPRHAELLAEQIDNKTVVKYLDRYLMWYMRTAKPLQRTAAWQERLEGGMEYLKQVIIEDSLGICDDLEEEMATLVNKFECEWTQAVNDPEMMKRFNHFVNSDEEDDNIVFVPMRDQKMPQPWK